MVSNVFFNTPFFNAKNTYVHMRCGRQTEVNKIADLDLYIFESFFAYFRLNQAKSFYFQLHFVLPYKYIYIFEIISKIIMRSIISLYIYC